MHGRTGAQLLSASKITHVNVNKDEYQLHSVPYSTSQKNSCILIKFDNNRYNRERHEQISVFLLQVPEEAEILF